MFFAQVEENIQTGYYKEIHYLETNSKIIRLKFDQKQQLPKDMSTVEVIGLFENNVFLAKHLKDLSPELFQTMKIDDSAYKGTRKIAAIRVAWNGSLPTCDESSISNAILGGVNDRYNDMSEHSFNFTLDHFGPFELNAVTQPSLETVYSQMMDQLFASGVSPAPYQHIMMFLPSNWSASYSGMGGSKWTAIRGCGSGLISHEIGHALGLGHATRDTYSYGDSSDFMGGSGAWALNAPHTEYLGWLDNVLEVSASGNYEIAAMELKEGQTILPQAIKIWTGNRSSYTYFAFRNSSNLNSTYRGKLNIHKMKSLVTTDVQSPIDVGATYTDSDSGISVKVISKDASSMSLQVNLTCVRHPPSIENFSGSYTKRIGAHNEAENLVIRNKDSVACSDVSEIQLHPNNSHPGIQLDISKNSVSLAPGSAEVLSYTYRADTSVPQDNTYNLQLQAISSNGQSTTENLNITFSGQYDDPYDSSFSVTLHSPQNNQIVAPGSTVQFNPVYDNVDYIFIRLQDRFGEYIVCQPEKPCEWALADTLNQGYIFVAQYENADRSLEKFSNTISVQTSADSTKTDYILPTIRYSSHNKEIFVPKGAIIQLQVLATDNVGVSRVDFNENLRGDGLLICSDAIPPYDCQWSPQGSIGEEMYLAARAFDEAGNSSYTRLKAHIVAPVDNLDLIPPEVTITNPNDSDQVSGNVTVSANASDDKSINLVNFYINGELVHSDNSEPYSYNWNTTTDFDGTFIIKARAIDAGLNVADHQITVTTNNGIHDLDAPTLEITSPNKGELLGAGSIIISATAYDNVDMDRVEFFVDGQLIETDKTEPYSANWNSSSTDAGSHIILAKAYDINGNSSEKNINITVDPVKPFVHINTPGDGNLVGTGATVNITATASDNMAVENVRFRVNGSTLCNDSTAPYECSWIVSNSPNKNYLIEAIAFDTAGNEEVSEVTVISQKGAGDGGSNDPPEDPPKDTPPTLHISSHVDGDTVSQTILIEAEAYDDKGVISVKFYINDTLVKEDTSSPYNYSWDTTQLSSL